MLDLKVTKTESKNHLKNISTYQKSSFFDYCSFLSMRQSIFLLRQKQFKCLHIYHDYKFQVKYINEQGDGITWKMVRDKCKDLWDVWGTGFPEGQVSMVCVPHHTPTSIN